MIVSYAVDSINAGEDFVSNGVVEFEKLLQHYKTNTFVWNSYVQCLEKNSMYDECRFVLFVSEYSVDLKVFKKIFSFNLKVQKK